MVKKRVSFAALRLSARNGFIGSAQQCLPQLRDPKCCLKTEKRYAQRLSKVSELFENLENIMLNDSPKCRNLADVNGSVVVPYVSDGGSVGIQNGWLCSVITGLGKPFAERDRYNGIILHKCLPQLRDPKCCLKTI